MKKSNIKYVEITTLNKSFLVIVAYVSGRRREYEVTDLSELKRTELDVVIGNENTVIVENSTRFFNMDNSTENDVDRYVAISAEWAYNITVRGMKLDEWATIMVYTIAYPTANFRILSNGRVNTCPTVKETGKYTWESTSNRSILASAVTKCETHDLISFRVHR